MKTQQAQSNDESTQCRANSHSINATRALESINEICTQKQKNHQSCEIQQIGENESRNESVSVAWEINIEHAYKSGPWNIKETRTHESLKIMKP
jgi:hypothetical protein